MCISHGFAGNWLVGQGADYTSFYDLFTYLESFSTPLDQYNVLVIGPTTDTQNFVFANASLDSMSVEWLNPNNLCDFNDAQIFNFSSLAQPINLNLNFGYIQYNFSTSKNFIVPSAAGIPSFQFNCFVTNNSADGVNTYFIDGGNYTNITSDTSAFISISNSSAGGFKDVIWLGGPLVINGNANTVKNAFIASGVGVNSVFNILTLGGTFASGAAYANPILNCNKLVIESLYVSVNAPVTIKAVDCIISNTSCDTGSGAVYFDIDTRLKIAPSFTNTGRALLYDGGMYTFDGVTWEGLDLHASFDACSLKVISNRFSGAGEGIVGADWAKNSYTTVSTSGTTETIMAELDTSSYTFTSDGDAIDFWSQLENNLPGLGTVTNRIKIGGSTYTISTTQAGKGQLLMRFVRVDSGTLRFYYNYEIINTLAGNIQNFTDVTISTIAPINIDVTAQMSNGSDTCSFYGSCFKLTPQA